MSALDQLLRADLRGRTAYGAPQLDVPVRLNTNENSYDVPAEVVDAVVAAVAEVAGSLNRYPDREFTALREDLAAYLSATSGYRSPRTRSGPRNGSNEVLLHLLQAFGGQGRTALGFTPAYSMHPIIARTVGTTWVDGLRGVQGGDGSTSTADGVAAQVAEHRPHLVFLCSPNNPTGTALGLDVVRAVYEAAPDAIVVVDEAYAEFARPGTPSALTLLPGRERLVVTRTMSKAFALAGARLGYLAATPALSDALRLVRLPYHLSALTQAVARAALAHAGALLATVEVIKSQRDRIVAELTAMGLEPVPSDANFVLFGGLEDEHATWQALLDARRAGPGRRTGPTSSSHGGTPDETDAFLAALGRLAPTHRQEQSA